MDPHQALLRKLQQHPELKHTEVPQRICIEAITPHGFGVELHSQADHWPHQWTVYLGTSGFHETFSVPDDVMNFLAWCYSGRARLREFRRGSSPQKVVLESLEDGIWREVSMTGYLLVPFWLELHETILINPNLLSD